MLLNKSSYHVARVRDASKVQVPKLLNERFSRELTAEERTALTNGLMKTDAGALRHVMSSVNIRRMYQDPAALDREVASHRGPGRQPDRRQAARRLARPGQGPDLLIRNDGPSLRPM